jgi:hypothetical protein
MLPCQLDGVGDIPVFPPLVAAAQQDDDADPAVDEIDPVAGAMIDPHLRNAAAHRFHVARIAERQAPDAYVMRARASRSRKLANQAAKTSVCRTSII